MGLKLHYAKKYEVQWAMTSCFNQLQEDLNKFLYDLCGSFDDYLGEDICFTEQFEINKDSLREMIDELGKCGDNELPSRLLNMGITCLNIRDFLSEALEHSDPNSDYVVFAWF
jgi:hypothetical protein